jgi:hypothetical protein
MASSRKSPEQRLVAHTPIGGEPRLPLKESLGIRKDALPPIAAPCDFSRGGSHAR